MVRLFMTKASGLNSACEGRLCNSEGDHLWSARWWSARFGPVPRSLFPAFTVTVAQSGGFMEYQLFIDGRWVKGSRHMEIKNKYNGETVGVIPIATRDDVEEALAAAQRASV